MRTSPSSALFPLVLLTCGQAVAQTLPTRFEHERVFLEALAPDGERIVFYTDTGGGYNAIARSIAEQYSLMPKGTTVFENGEYGLVAFPPFAEAAGIPPPAPDAWLEGNLVVVPDGQLEASGFLGSRWFAGRIWEFDYGRKTLVRIEALESTTLKEVPLGFRHDVNGKRDLNFPRINVVVDGQPLSMLLDTGATAELTESSGPVYGLTAGTRVGTSYITRSIFESWRTNHPNWRVIEEADVVTGQAFPMIEVPSVEVAGITVGPVWFSQRPDDTFRKWMSRMTDRPIEGAIGGSMLKYLCMVIDYPGAKAYFRALPSTGRNTNDT